MEEVDKQAEEIEIPGAWWLKSGVTPPTVCNVSPLTQEFVSLGVADPSPLEPGIWLTPANAYMGDAPIVFPGFAAIRVEGDELWQLVPDHRGKTVYDKETRSASVCDALGELPEALTLEAPRTGFDVWHGGRWVLDQDARNSALISQVRLKKTYLAQCAAGLVSTLQYAVDKGIATDAEEAALDAWRTYSVLLSRIEPAPAVTWPESPDNAALTAWLESKGYEDLPDLPAEAP